MCPLVNAQYWTGLAGGNRGRLFLSFGGLVCADQNSNCPLDRALTYKNLISLLYPQWYPVGTLAFPTLQPCVERFSALMLSEENYTKFAGYLHWG